jgi:hypothetical protein
LFTSSWISRFEARRHVNLYVAAENIQVLGDPAKRAQLGGNVQTAVRYVRRQAVDLVMAVSKQKYNMSRIGPALAGRYRTLVQCHEEQQSIKLAMRLCVLFLKGVCAPHVISLEPASLVPVACRQRGPAAVTQGQLVTKKRHDERLRSKRPALWPLPPSCGRIPSWQH